MNLPYFLFGIALFTASLMIVGLIVQIKGITSFFPPPNRKRQLLSLGLIFSFYGLWFAAAFFSPQLAYHVDILGVIGIILIISGGILTIWSFLMLKLKRTLGCKGKLCTKAPYSFCRNPQTLGLVTITIGLILLLRDWLMVILGLGHITVLVLSIFAEETWLEKTYGQRYQSYLKGIPRLLPHPKNICRSRKQRNK